MSSPTTTAESQRLGLLERVTCPHCWERFPPEDVLWISEHTDLLGDPRLGADEQQRFLPTRFSVGADALDAKEFPCDALACPKCHLGLPRPLLEMEPLFLSIFGAPASGKSYFLASMTWKLRQILGPRFALSFTDSDPVLNRVLNEYEEALFLNPRSDDLHPLAGLIRKTEEHGELYDSVSYGNQTVRYPRPFLFSMQPQDGHPNVGNSRRLSRVVCLYDNAGESFQPGKDVVGSPVTRHMAHSRALFFVYDPTQDQRFRQMCLRDPIDDTLPADERVARQEPVLQEAIARIRRHAKLRQTDKHNRPLIVILTKYDVWSHLLQELTGEDHVREPWREVRVSDDTPIAALDGARVERVSQFARELLLRACPEIVSAAEGFARDVFYVPVSAVGWDSRRDPNSGLLSIRPVDAQPYWVTVPFLYALNQWTPGLIPGLKRKGAKR